MTWSITVAPTPDDAARTLANRLVELAGQANAKAGRFTLALSGGRTPEGLYRLLGNTYAHELPWSTTELFFADERMVPPEDPRSNFGLVNRTLLQPLAPSPPRVHRIAGELASPEEAARRYEAELRGSFNAGAGGPPGSGTFDAVLLGVGADGHTASLFPGAASLQEAERWTVVEPSPHLDPKVTRVSLTLPVIRAAHHALFLVCGEDKQAIVQQVFSDPGRGTLGARLPSAAVAATEGVEWYFDAGAAPRGPAPSPS